MYELSRVRLHSVGPPGARYQDVLLDFSGAGAKVQSQQGDLLEVTEPPRRPSPASVLFLENGGGKSVLIKLIFSVMLPGRRQVVGTTSTRVLEKFVLPNDVAHVALEWMHTGSGERLVTGKVSEWRGHVSSADPANLIDTWYCFRPSEALELETLPLTKDNRLLTVSAFRDRLGEAQSEDPGIDLFWTRRRGEWTERLDMLGLDTELFRYQRAMNAGEGEAADAFSFATDEAFVEFLLRAVLPEDGPVELAEVLTNYSESLAQRGELNVERDFVAGALELCGPLAKEEALTLACRAEAERVYAQLAGFAGAVDARVDVEQARLEEYEAGLTEAQESLGLAESTRRRAAAEVAALRRAVAGLRLSEAEAERVEADEVLAETRRTADAWRETSTVLEQRGAAESARRLRELAHSLEEKARPALAAKNAAAQALARGLLALAKDAGQAAEREQASAAEQTERAAQAQARQNEATSEAATATARADALAERVEEVRARLRTAAGEGLLDSAGEDVTSAAARAGEALETARERLAEHEAEAERIGEAHSAAQLTLQEARQGAATAAERNQRAGEAKAEAEERIAVLEAEPRLAALLDVEDIRLDSDYSALRRLLAESSAEAGRVRLELEVAEASDKQARLALAGGDLLPPPPEIGEVCAVLEEEGITAWPGWTFLAAVGDVAERARIAEHAPQLASGVLLNKASQLEFAKQILTERELYPNTFIAIGTTDSLRAGGVAPGADFVVPSNPALYDPHAAAREQEAIARRHTERQDRLTELTERQRADDELAARLERWREEYPEGSATELAAAVEFTETAVAEAEQRVRRCEQELDRLATERAGLRESVPAAREKLRATEENARRLSELAELSEHLREWTEAEQRERENVARAAERATEAGDVAELARAEAAEHQRAADGHTGTADRARAELAEVPGAGEVSAADPAPEEPIEVLRRTYRSAEDSYARVEVGSDLRAELDQAERAEAVSLAAFEALDPEVRELASELLETPEGSDASARTAARERAARAVEAAENRRSNAIALVATRKAELAGLPEAREAEVPQPRDIAHGQQLVDAAIAEESEAAREHERRVREHETAERALASARASTEGFGVLLDSTDARPDGEQEPFEGDIEAARSRYATLRGEWTHAQETANRAEERVRQASDSLAQFATESRFEQLQVPVRRQMLAVRRAELPTYSGEWAEALRPRLRTLTDDLAAIDRHRSGIITRLHGMVEDALRTLRSAQRVSRLPDGLGDWSGQEFLRIAFGSLEDTELVERLGEVVDEAATGKNGTPQGMSLLLRGVLAAAPKGFRIEMLKPDAVLRTERQRVSEIRDVFSGGQQLTAAIILYCTMAALRANNRGRAKHRHSGVLFLDNPIGRASAGYLLELQRAVARALGVQLIYTTGLFDANALAEFPMIVRLRNDADLRAGRKYLAVEETIKAELDALPEADETAGLTSTRIFFREIEPTIVEPRVQEAEG
ncbi:hypothetical protein [Sciscionella marina]|uniref:hypothetical protein n=1 Tax=Sciscionella marina TaxID=508770 RepID=UPI00035E2D57|nr:hypothetical protein [Sciscionella marina]